VRKANTGNQNTRRNLKELIKYFQDNPRGGVQKPSNAFTRDSGRDLSLSNTHEKLENNGRSVDECKDKGPRSTASSFMQTHMLM